MLPLLVGSLAALSCGLRFWQLAQFNTLVFDEIYFVRFAQDYLSGVATFDAHPPLGKYLIATGIWLYGLLPFPASSLSYRWLNALVGSAIPLIVVGLAHTLGKRSSNTNIGANIGAKSIGNNNRLRTFAMLSGCFVAIDGLFVVESRYGLINIYMLFFGLLGQWLWLLQAELNGRKITFLQMLLGISLGAAIATKWNGLGFALSLFVWEISRLKAQKVFKSQKIIKGEGYRSHKRRDFLKSRLAELCIWFCCLSSLTYFVVWLPHIWLSQESLVALHSSLFSFHHQLSSEGHPACSRWFTWPLLVKPIAYWYEKTEGLAYTVNNMGNPVLWWLSSAAMLLMFIDKVNSIRRREMNALTSYLLISYGSNWLPWLLVSRCTFIYLYMPAAVFSFIGLAWVMSGWLHSRISWVRTMGWAMGFLIAIAFLFWLPLSLGIPLSPDALQIRWWLKSWI